MRCNYNIVCACMYVSMNHLNCRANLTWSNNSRVQRLNVSLTDNIFAVLWIHLNKFRFLFRAYVCVCVRAYVCGYIHACCTASVLFSVVQGTLIACQC